MSMRRTSKVLGLGIAVGVVLAVIFRALVLDPARWIGDDSLVLLASDDCAFSNDLYQQIRATPRLAERVQVVPIDGGHSDRPTVRMMCGTALAQLRNRGVWQLRLLPDNWACGALIAFGNETHTKHFLYYPAWMKGPQPLEDGDLLPALAERGLQYDGKTNTLWFLGEELPASRRESLTMRAVDDDNPLSHAVGHTIGW
ncbi:hypothetical protein K7C98_16090 [Nannocystis pusilla]|uniref:DUF218 domain-containing protein n=2 Tax=Nannocystis pusilla TaxID=889268 RepID=A0ABS7TRE9_9BACT|nr:hypothetical protein [Nannocystis pusilla]